MNSTFKRNLIITYLISLTLIIISAIASWLSINSLLNSTDQVNHTNRVINELEHSFSLLKDAETGQRGFLLTNNEIFLDPYNSSKNELPQLINSLKTSMSDNAEQVANLVILNKLVNRRLDILASLIKDRREGKPIIPEALLTGKMYMDSCRALVTKMENIEQALLTQRTTRQNRFAASTPVLIIVASLLSILVTVISFRRIIKDFEKRTVLQRELQQKDEQIARRLELIQGIANKISAGDYKIRVDDEGKDALSGIAGSLNVMATSLDESFTDLSNKQWLQTGIASLNDEMLGDKDQETLARSILNFVTEYSNSQAGAFYLISRQGTLELISSYALSGDNKKYLLQPGEGLAGQSAMAGKILEVKGIDTANYTLSFVSGNVRLSSVIAIPITFNRSVKGVIELASMQDYPPLAKTFFETVSYNAGIAINTAQSRQKVQELLEETQAQSEELQAQQSELENVNAELEAQAEKLQASEEELRVQQEELQQANQELEERSRLLEEKNELILERNLDIQAKAEELELSTKYKSEFLANMSHELRTPLNSILLLSRLLSENHEGNLSRDQIEYAGVIQNSGNGLLTLIDEILDLSKIESGKMELEWADVKIEEITDNLQSLFAPLAKEKGIEFAIETAGDAPGMIETDKLRIEQILRNLISNALKFTKKGSVKLKIDKQENAILFSVIDTGIGIPSDKHQTVFEAFQQADGSTRRQYGGTGLGLSISRELAKLLGGEITLKSEPDKGSHFTLIIPTHKDAIAKEGGKFPPSSFIETTTATVNGNGGDKRFISDIIPASIADDRDSIKAGDKIILIIEDDTGFARSLLDYTRANGYKGLVAVRGDEGVALAKQFLPLGILLDVQLPVKSGWEVMEELKSLAETRPIPVHMMSSHEVKTKGLSKGAVDFISKPVTFEKMGEMFNKIEQALSRHPKKVLIVEENTKHAEALSFFLGNHEVNSEIKKSVEEGIRALNSNEVDCVILDMGIPAQRSYDTLEEVKKTAGLENIPIIIFTGKNLSHVEERKIRQYADSIVIKTAQSYQRILDEVSLFLHLVEENKKDGKTARYRKMGELTEVLRGKTVLVADDDVRNIFSLTKSLETYGMNVITAIDGKDALKQLQEQARIDLVLMDMMMPEMDGYESTRRIREIHRYRKLPIIAVTAKAMTGDREKCIAAGASDYITKPVDVDQLISLLRVWLYE